MAQGQLIGMEQTYQPLQWMLKGFFQSPDNARDVSRVHICSHPTTFMFCVFAFSSSTLAINDSVMLESDWGVVWLNYEEPGVTGQNIPPAGVYPGILWPRPIYNPGIFWPRPIHTPSGHNIPRCIYWPRPLYPGII